MNRNVESHFAQVPHANIPRSRFDRSYSHITTFNVGDVVPIYIDQTVMPGDTVTLDTSMVVRLQTLLKPIFDNIYLDTYFFAIPKRLLWSHWKEFMGENTSSEWLPAVTYTEPQMAFINTSGETDGQVKEGSVADYLGLPVGMTGYVSALPFRAYAMVCNEWFRDQNLTDPLVLINGDSNTDSRTGSTCEYGGTLFKASKYHDYFTSCLPAPLKAAEPVSVPASFTPGIIGMVSPWLDNHNNLYDEVNGNTTLSANRDYVLRYHNEANTAIGNSDITFNTVKNTDDQNRQAFVENTYSSVHDNGRYYLRPDNLYAYVPKAFSLTSGSPIGGLNVSIMDLRSAFQVEKLLERDARSGTRYTEVIRSHFSVTSPDSRLQRPEYLGGNRINISVHQVINQSQGETEFLGNLGAFGMTTNRHSAFTYSASEHCVILGVCVARYDHTYSQGVDRSWLNHSRLDYYWPELACISEQPVYLEEIYVANNVPQTKKNYTVFGYQEAYAYLRYAQNRCSAEMRPDAALSLASWHLGDDYNSRPYLSDSWIREDKSNVDRVLAVTSATSNQILLDVRFNQFWTRPMPLFGVPGLVDHF